MKVALYSILLLFPLGLSAHGLRFNNVRSEDNAKTSYEVFKYKTPSFENYFSLSFDLSICDHKSFGYIFRVSDIYADNKNGYSFVYSNNDLIESYLKFNIEGKQNRISDTLSTEHLGERQWMHIEAMFYLKEDSVVIKIDNRIHTTTDLGLSSPFKPSILFGSSAFTEDVPAFAIKNLRVQSSNIDYFFALNESNGDKVHNADRKVVGETTCPSWLINDSYNWRKRFEYTSNSVAGINYDHAKHRLLIINADSLLSYDMIDNQVTSHLYINPIPMNMALGTNFIDTDNQLLYAYEVNNLPQGDVTSSVLDLNTLKWSIGSYEYLLTQRHQHASYYSAKENKYIIFGGFGTRQYSNEFVVYDPTTHHWSALEFDDNKLIAPRFFTSIGELDTDKLLIFGGTGNEVGDQTVGRFNYYDLYSVDLKQKSITKLWELDKSDEFVPGRNLIISEDKQSFYALHYQVQLPLSYLKVGRYSILNGDCEIVGDSIPITSRAITTNANIYYDDRSKEFYCCVQEFEDGKNISHITLYSLSSPAVSAAALSVYPQNREQKSWFIICISLLCGGVIGSVLLRQIKVRKRRETERSEQLTSLKQSEPSINQDSNALYLFGDFTVYDRRRKDITYLFSAKIKQLFLLILINSDDDHAGITSARISEVLWPDKSAHNAKNLKGVTMNHLRKILDEMDGVELNFSNNNFRIVIDERFYCDYIEYILLMRKFGIDKVSPSDQSSHDPTRRLVKLLSRGKFLKSLNGDSFDTLKGMFEEQVLTTLPFEMENLYRDQDFVSVRGFASVLLQIDSLSEVALWYEINSLRKLKREPDAVKRYYLFTVEYSKTMGEEYHNSYEQIIGSDLGAFLS